MSSDSPVSSAARWILLGAAFAAVSAGPAQAFWDDKARVFLAQSINSDNNLFRLSGDVDAEPILGAPSRDDRYRTTTVGLNLDVPLASQRIVGDIMWMSQRYDRFGSLDHDGHLAELAWVWRGGRRFEGRVGFDHGLRRGSFSNLQGGIFSNTRNLIETRETYVDAAFRITTRFELGASVAGGQQSNSAPEFAVSNAQIDRSDLTFSYVAGSGNRAGLRYRIYDGRLPEPQLVDGILVDNSYEQHETSLLLDWRLSEPSRVDLSLDRISRAYPQAATRNYSDWGFSAGYEWRPTAAFSLMARAEKGISETEEINVGFVVARRLALIPTLRVTEKIELSGEIGRSDRRYLGDPALEAIEGSLVTERLRVAGLTVAWTPIQRLRFAFAWHTDGRTSNLPFVDYDANVASLEVRASW